MCYRLRLYSDDRLLVTTDHETIEEAGRQVADFPLDDPADVAPGEPSQVYVRAELVYRDELGHERPATAMEDDELFDAIARRMAEAARC